MPAFLTHMIGADNILNRLENPRAEKIIKNRPLKIIGSKDMPHRGIGFYNTFIEKAFHDFINLDVLLRQPRRIRSRF